MRGEQNGWGRAGNTHLRKAFLHMTPEASLYFGMFAVDAAGGHGDERSSSIVLHAQQKLCAVRSSSASGKRSNDSESCA